MKSAELKKSLLLYAVTDRAWLGKNFCCETLSDAVLQAIEGGATLIQLREKELSEKEFLEEAFSKKNSFNHKRQCKNCKRNRRLWSSHRTKRHGIN